VFTTAVAKHIPRTDNYLFLQCLKLHAPNVSVTKLLSAGAIKIWIGSFNEKMLSPDRCRGEDLQVRIPAISGSSPGIDETNVLATSTFLLKNVDGPRQNVGRPCLILKWLYTIGGNCVH